MSDYYITILKKLDGVIKDQKQMEQRGMISKRTKISKADAERCIYGAADEIQKQDPKLSQEQATARAMLMGPHVADIIIGQTTLGDE